MSQLIHLRQRIKAVTTIKKITSAMRLISRSFHTRMYRDMKSLNEYTKHIHTLFYKLYDTCELSQVSVPFLKKEEETTHSGKILFILVGSQKGLCGNYNTTITHWIDKNKALLQERDVHVFTLSKKIDEYLKKNHIPVKKTFPELKLSTIDEITKQLFAIIKNNDVRYSQISIVANQPKTFFSHEYKTIQIIPFEKPAKESIDQTNNLELVDDYVWSHNPQLLFETLYVMLIKNTLYTTLFVSLLGEQSARFVAMDNATRNAQNFLNSMNIQFNKIRQAKITKELSELAGAFDSQ